MNNNNIPAVYYSNDMKLLSNVVQIPSTYIRPTYIAHPYVNNTAKIENINNSTMKTNDKITVINDAPLSKTLPTNTVIDDAPSSKPLSYTAAKKLSIIDDIPSVTVDPTLIINSDIQDDEIDKNPLLSIDTSTKTLFTDIVTTINDIPSVTKNPTLLFTNIQTVDDGILDYTIVNNTKQLYNKNTKSKEYYNSLGVDIITSHTLLYPVYYISKVVEINNYQPITSSYIRDNQTCYTITSNNNNSITCITSFLDKENYKSIRRDDYYYALVSKFITTYLAPTIPLFINYYGYSYANYYYTDYYNDNLTMIMKPRLTGRKRKQLVHYQEDIGQLSLTSLLVNITVADMVQYLYQICVGLQQAQTICQFMHTQLSSDNIIIQQLPYPIILYDTITTSSVVRLVNYSHITATIGDNILYYDSEMIFNPYHDIITLLLNLMSQTTGEIQELIQSIIQFINNTSSTTLSSVAQYIASLYQFSSVENIVFTFKQYVTTVRESIIANVQLNTDKKYELYTTDDRYQLLYDSNLSLSNLHQINTFFLLLDLYLDVRHYQSYKMFNYNNQLPYLLLHNINKFIYGWYTIIYETKMIQYRFNTIYNLPVSYTYAEKLLLSLLKKYTILS